MLDTRSCLLEQSIRALASESISSAAALQVHQFLGETTVYPLMVLAHACMIAHGTPMTCFIDALFTVLGNLLHKELHVQLGSYESKNRHWWTGAAGTSQGTSENTKPFSKKLSEVLWNLFVFGPW